MGSGILAARDHTLLTVSLSSACADSRFRYFIGRPDLPHGGHRVQEGHLSWAQETALLTDSLIEFPSRPLHPRADVWVKGVPKFESQMPTIEGGPKPTCTSRSLHPTGTAM